MRVQYSIYKLPLSYVHDLAYAITKNDLLDHYLIDLADNQLFRLLRTIKNVDIESRELFDLLQTKKRLKEKLFKKPTPANEKKLADVLEQLKISTLIPEIVFFEIPEYGDKKEMKAQLTYTYEKGVVIDGKRFVRWGKSGSMTRHNIIMFIDESFYDRLYERAGVGIQIKDVVIAKWEAYFNLLLSSSEFVSLPYIVVVDDYCKILPPSPVQFVVDQAGVDKKTGKEFSYKDIERITKNDISINCFDGQGLHIPPISKKFADEIGIA